MLTYRILYVIMGLEGGGKVMIATNYTSVRNNLKDYMDQVIQDFETVIVTRKKDENVVMISEKAYNNLLENAYLLSDKENFDWLMESKQQYERGELISQPFPEEADE